MGDHQDIVNELIRRGQEALEAKCNNPVPFTEDPSANRILNNIEQYPHIFILGCIADRRIPAQQAWLSAYEFCRNLLPDGPLTFTDVYRNLQAAQNQLPQIAHRFSGIMVQNFRKAIQRIHDKYNGDAGAIWANNPVCATIVRRLLEFDGVGLKIANMGTNILLRDFKVSMQHRETIDMPVDGNVLGVFKRLGLVPENTSKKEVVIYEAKALYADYPAVFDKGAWEIGTYWCHSRRPNCQECYMHEHCPSAI